MMDHRRAIRFLAEVLGASPERQGRPFELDLPSGPVPADVYRPRGRPWGTVVAVHGMTLRGHQDPRLTGACTALAATGLQVVAPRIEPLATLSLSSDAGERIREVVAAVLASAPLGRPRQVGLLAASFAGGQALAAAAHPTIRDRVAALLLVGAYADAGAMLRHAMSSPGADPYGRLVVLRRFLAETGEEPLRDVVEVALADESLCRDTPQLPLALAALSPGSRGRFLALRDDPEVGAALARRILDEQAPAVRELSVTGAIPQVRAPVTLVHGDHDPVIPSSESMRIQRLLHAAGRACRLCTTRLLHRGDLDMGPRALLDIPAVVRVFGHWFRTLDSLRC